MEKWQNTDAGPRQCKDLERAISNLSMEGKTFTELYGVAGGEEHSSNVMSLMGPVRSEVAALDEAIRERYGYTVTKKNVREIIADYEAALPEARESRPVKDNRRTQQEDAEIAARMAVQAAEEKARQDARNALLEQVMAKAPAGAQALIVAEYHQDNSDVMTDYFSNQTTRTVAIGFRSGRREDFRQLHAAARSFSETAGVQFTERRDNYSMGKGNYLSDHGWDGAGSGWVVKSVSFPCKWVHLTEDAIADRPAAAPVPAASAGDGVTISPSSLGKEGVIEIRFADKPDEAVRETLKRVHGFRWAKSNGCWYGRDTQEVRAFVAA